DYYSGYPLTTPSGWTLVSAQTNGQWGATYYSHVVATGETNAYNWPSQGASVLMWEIAKYDPNKSFNLVVGATANTTSGQTTATGLAGTPTVLGTLAISVFSPDVQTVATGVSTGWTPDGCDLRTYNTLCSATRSALTSDTTTPISNTFTYSGTPNAFWNSTIFIAPGSAGTAPVATPVASLASGSYASAQTVTLTVSQPTLSIHYTIDNSAPTCASATYAGPLTLDATTVLSEVACDSSGAASQVVTNSYVVGAGTLKGMALGTMADLHGFVPFASSTPDAWQTPITNTALDPNSATILSYIQSQTGSGIQFDMTMTFNVVDSLLTPFAPVFSLNDPSYINQSDVTYLPVGPFTPIESNPTAICVTNNQGNIGNSDNHLITLDRRTGILGEAWHTRRGCTGQRPGLEGSSDLTPDPTQTAYIAATNIAIFDLLYPSGFQRPFNYTSADAGGLSIFQGTARYDEFALGRVKHALRFTLPVSGGYSANGDVYAYYSLPAKHGQGRSQPLNATNLLKYGMRLRLRSSYTPSSSCNSAIFSNMMDELQNYGMMMADLGATVFQVQATPDPRWNANDVACFNAIPLSAFDAVDTSTVYYGVNSQYPLDPNSVQTGQGTVVATPIHGTPVPVLTAFSAGSSTITSGQCTTLTAQFTNAAYAYVDKGRPMRSGETQSVCPTATTVYKLTLQSQSLIQDDGSGDGANDANTANGRLIKSLTVTVTPALYLLYPRGAGKSQGYRRH
ncbi:MAG: chitobiase/beta-hexosaminidase C-terminal domain-containing protein, partial [Janthinobacterium lividum]